MKPVEMPAWARTGVHPEYPEHNFVLAFGAARTPQQSQAIAAERLEEQIVAYALGRGQAALRGTHFAAVVVERANWFALSEFGESVQSDEAGNGFEYVSMRAIHRGDLELRARGMIEEARNAMITTPAPGRTGDLRRRVHESSAAFITAARLLALKLLEDGTVDRPALERAETAAMGLWELPGLVRIETAGEGQMARIGGGLAQPLGMRATFGGQPQAGLPLRWGLALGLRGVLNGAPETDSLGVATCDVLQLAPTGDEFGHVQCQLDLDRMTTRRTGVSVPAWLWKLVLPCRRNTELIISVKETIDESEKGFERYFLPGLREWCRGRNLDVSIDQPSLRKYTYRLRLEGEINVSTWLRGNVPMARTAGRLILKDESDGSILYEWTPGLLREGEPGHSTDGLGMLTLREVAAEGLVDFCPRLVSAAPAPNEEFTHR